MEEKAKPAPQKKSFFTKLKHPSQFSKPQLAIFVLAFALIGYLIYHSFAASTLVATLQSEQMTLPSGASVISDSTASGGKAVKMTSSGTASGSVDFASSVTSLTAMAKSDSCQGNPDMTISLDGKALLSNVSVSGSSWTAYSVTPATAITSGTHNLSIAFTNPNTIQHGKSPNNCTRALYSDVTYFYGPTTVTPAPTVALSASPTSVTSGQSSTLTWTSTNATSCTASGAWSGTEPVSGSVSTGAINQTSTYSLTCTGAGGSATASTTVTVSAGFTTSLTQNMTITPPYTWTFNPGVSSVKGYFYADGTLLSTTTPDASGTYTYILNNNVLTSGGHKLAGSWDLADGTHQEFPQAYAVTINNTTGGTTSGSCNGGTAYCNAISYTQTRPGFTPTRTVNVSSASQLLSAISNLQPGDLVKAAADFTVTGTTNINKKLSSPAVIDLTGHSVKFVYSAGSNAPAVSIYDAANIRLYGGDLSTSDSGGVCLELMASSHILWWGFTGHDCGSSAIRMMTGNSSYSSSGPDEYNDIQGEVWKMGQNPNWSTHTEKCSGLHGANIADGNYFLVAYNRIALYAHDSACTGGGISFGSSQSTNIPTTNTIYLKCANLTFVSITQTGGNCYQTWGYGNHYTDIKYLEADNLMGHAYFAGGLYNKPNSYLSTDTTEYGRANSTDQNSRYAKDCTFNKEGNPVFQDILSVSPNQSTACYAPFSS